MIDASYKGYIARFSLPDEEGLIHGRVINTRDVITCYGETEEEARQAFCDSVDDYLDFCASRGELPEKGKSK